MRSGAHRVQLFGRLVKFLLQRIEFAPVSCICSLGHISAYRGYALFQLSDFILCLIIVEKYLGRESLGSVCHKKQMLFL